MPASDTAAGIQPSLDRRLKPAAASPAIKRAARWSTVAEAIRGAADRLLAIAEHPRLEARLLLAGALGLTQSDLIRDLNRTIDTEVFNRFVLRREAHEPVALILGRREFWSMEFLVSQATLIPRADSETVIEAALAAFAERPTPQRILDLGTGTGCLLLALLAEFPFACGIGVDISPAAARLAQCNAARLGLSDRCSFVSGDWTDCLHSTFDLVVANPPYVASTELAELMPDVVRYEPRQALDGGADGYDAYRAILPRLRGVVAVDGVAVLEVGAGQADKVGRWASESGFTGAVRPDLAGIGRAVALSKSPL